MIHVHDASFTKDWEDEIGISQSEFAHNEQGEPTATYR